MIPIRLMLPEGENQFREYIRQVRTNLSTARPDLNSNPFSQEFSPQIMVDETKTFMSKLELAEYLYNCFRVAGIRREHILGKNKLWTWLAYLWFDQLAPVRCTGTGGRAIGEDAKYICSSDYRDYYRHFVAGPYSIYSLHGRDNSLLFLHSPVYEHNDFIEQFASRQFIISYPEIVKAVTKLYFDSNDRKPKRGAQSRDREGNIRRFVKVIRQFELTFNIYTMDCDKILNILPDEFNVWKQG